MCALLFILDFVLSILRHMLRPYRKRSRKKKSTIVDCPSPCDKQMKARHWEKEVKKKKKKKKLLNLSNNSALHIALVVSFHYVYEKEKKKKKNDRDEQFVLTRGIDNQLNSFGICVILRTGSVCQVPRPYIL